MRFKRPLTLLLLMTLLLLVPGAAFASGNLWTYKNASELNWHRVTAAGTVIVGADDTLLCLDPESGKILWRRDEFKNLPQTQVDEVVGTPFLLVSQNTSGFTQAKTALYALSLEDGTTVWESEKLKGATIGVYPVYDQDMVVMFTSRDAREAKTKPGMTAFQLSSGEMLWDVDWDDKIDLHTVENVGKWVVHFDLSGHQDPVAANGSLYVPFAGVHKYDLKTGKLLWKSVYDVTEGKLKKGNAPIVVQDGIVYSSAKGQLRAFEDASGALKWTSADFGAGVAEVQVTGNLVYGRMGGTFYDYSEKEWKLKKPLGVVALSKTTGQAVWKYDKAEDGITNMLLLPEQNAMVIADAKSLIGLDTSSENKPTELFRTKVEFKNKIGAGAAAMKVARFGMGGLQGGLKGLSDDKKAQDHPIMLAMQPNGTIVVRGRQHMLAFDPKSKTIPWSLQYAAPGLSNWMKFAMASIYAMNYMSSTATASQTYYGTSENNRANAQRQQMIRNFSKLMNERFSATKSGIKFVNILTNLEDGKDKGPGLVGVDMVTGQAAYQIVLKDKEPDYQVDEVTGRLYNLKGKELFAYSIR
jgi:outer membrane protein assembly factor BamB